MGDDRGAVAFAERVLALLDDGSFSTTYKYALLLALIDGCLEHTSSSGAAPTTLTTPQLARKVLELYWPHTAPFDPSSSVVLRQSSRGQAEIVEAVRRYRASSASPMSPLSEARARDPQGFTRLASAIEWKLVEMPLPRLQTVGSSATPFVYELGWTAAITKREFHSEAFDNRVLMLGRASEHLVRLAGLLRPLVQREWLARVARLNQLPEAHLADFLFGVSREALAPVRDELRELQHGRCFYCGGRLARDVHVDHFVPWARLPDNGIENLVVADAGCNRSKRAFLASADHVARWAARATTRARDLEEIAARRRWERDPERTAAIARALYLPLAEDARLWQRGREFVDADLARLRAALVAA